MAGLPSSRAISAQIARGGAAGDFIWNELALRELLRGPSGDVARDLAQRAQRVETQAKINASGRPGPNVDTGRLRASISWRLGEDSEGLYADIGTAVEYAGFVEELYPYLLPALEAARE